jgi:hypothetical protein
VLDVTSQELLFDKENNNAGNVLRMSEGEFYRYVFVRWKSFKEFKTTARYGRVNDPRRSRETPC